MTPNCWQGRPPRRGSDAGNAVVEAAILAPVLIMFLAGLLIGARIRNAGAAVDQAAADAARQASIARTPAQARTAATMVSARVTCKVRLSDVAAPGMPGSRTVTRMHRSPLDPFRGR
jgi:Flp pilus assembly protein TadG